jgi:hypothetical protein
VKPSQSTNGAQERNIKYAGPWCWQDKGALQMIRDYLEDRHGHSAFALSTYVALSELASDEQSGTFTAPINTIARRAGASYRTTAKILGHLERLKLIRVQRNIVPGTKEHAPSTYTMLGMPCLTLSKRDVSSLPKSSKNQKNPKKDNDTRTHTRNGQSSSLVWSLSLEEAKKDPLWVQFENYCLTSGGAPTLKGWNTWRPKQSANGATPPLASMKTKDLRYLRTRLIAERNSGKLSHEEMQAKRRQLVEVKQILKGRGIEYAPSL